MTERQQPLIRARVSNDVVDYVHNDIANAVWFFHDRLKRSFEGGERADGLFLDMIALVTMIAFSIEGYVNFIGFRLFAGDADGWGAFERRNVRDKLKELRRRLDRKIDWSKRPYATVGPLLELRNMFAHPKAHRPKERERILVGTDGDFRKLLREYKPEYEQRLTWEFVNMANEDVEAIWQELLHWAGIEAHETMSGGSQGFELIEHVTAAAESR